MPPRAAEAPNDADAFTSPPPGTDDAFSMNLQTSCLPVSQVCRA